MYCSMRLLPLFRHKVEIEAMELQRPSAELVKDGKGVWNFSSIGQTSQQASSAGTTDVVMEGNVTLHNSQVAVTNLQ